MSKSSYDTRLNIRPYGNVDQASVVNRSDIFITRMFSCFQIPLPCNNSTCLQSQRTLCFPEHGAGQMLMAPRFMKKITFWGDLAIVILQLIN